eukprot:1616749-Ditylum_brightwellii.AAC.1
MVGELVGTVVWELVSDLVETLEGVDRSVDGGVDGGVSESVDDIVGINIYDDARCSAFGSTMKDRANTIVMFLNSTAQQKQE